MKNILIVTGGTGGHVIPCLSIYEHLKDNCNVQIVTDERGSKFINKNDYKFTIIKVPNITKNIFKIPINIILFIISIFKSYFFLKKNNIMSIISSGGYMSFPYNFASYIQNINIILFEPNSVLGRSNKYFLPFSKKIISYDPNPKLFPKKYLHKIYHTKPILKKIFYEKKNKLKNEILENKKILILGGSQGAKFFDEEIFKLIMQISKKVKIEICQQVSDPNNIHILKEKYKNLNIKHRIFDFDNNIYNEYLNSDMAISRSGASTLSELSFFNIPFIAVPFPHAKDNHQFFNAEFYKKKQCCWIIKQEDFNISRVSEKIIMLIQQENEISKKKQHLKEFSKENTWNAVNKKLRELINEY